jgi:short subunit dehydrogenase-like uncharacterized protein
MEKCEISHLVVGASGNAGKVSAEDLKSRSEFFNEF